MPQQHSIRHKQQMNCSCLLSQAGSIQMQGCLSITMDMMYVCWHDFFYFVFIFRCDKHVFRNIRVASQLQVKLRKLTAHQDPTISGPYVWQVKYFLISRDNTQLPRFPDRSNFWQITWYLSNFASWISTAQELDWYSVWYQYLFCNNKNMDSE